VKLAQEEGRNEADEQQPTTSHDRTGRGDSESDGWSRPSAQPAPRRRCRALTGTGTEPGGKKIARGSGRRDATWARLESRRAPALALRHDYHERTPRPRRDRPFFCCTAPVAALVCIELCPFSGVWSSCWSAASATTATRSRTRMMLGRYGGLDASHCRVQPYTRERRREEPI
jgi:hypothetical protein